MKILISLLFLIGSIVSYSQEWQSYYSDDKVEIQFAQITYEKPSHSKSHERLVFNYVNKTNDELTVTFSRPNEYDGVRSASSTERTFTVVIPAGSEIGYDETHKSKTYYLFLRDNNQMIKRALTWFDIINIQYQ